MRRGQWRLVREEGRKWSTEGTYSRLLDIKSNSGTVRRSHAEVAVKNWVVVEKRIHRTAETVKKKTNASFLVQFWFAGSTFLSLPEYQVGLCQWLNKHFGCEALYCSSEEVGTLVRVASGVEWLTDQRIKVENENPICHQFETSAWKILLQFWNKHKNINGKHCMLTVVKKQTNKQILAHM